MENSININDDDNDAIKFIKKDSLHPRERFKGLSKTYLLRNQTDKIFFYKYYHQKH